MPAHELLGGEPPEVVDAVPAASLQRGDDAERCGSITGSNGDHDLARTERRLVPSPRRELVHQAELGRSQHAGNETVAFAGRIEPVGICVAGEPLDPVGIAAGRNDRGTGAGLAGLCRRRTSKTAKTLSRG